MEYEQQVKTFPDHLRFITSRPFGVSLMLQGVKTVFELATVMEIGVYEILYLANESSMLYNNPHASNYKIRPNAKFRQACYKLVQYVHALTYIQTFHAKNTGIIIAQFDNSVYPRKKNSLSMLVEVYPRKWSRNNLPQYLLKSFQKKPFNFPESVAMCASVLMLHPYSQYHIGKPFKLFDDLFLLATDFQLQQLAESNNSIYIRDKCNMLFFSKQIVENNLSYEITKIFKMNNIKTKNMQS